MPTNILVPAYFYPAGNTYWSDLASLASAGNTVTAIMNVSNGPSTSANSDYTLAVNNLVTAGGNVVGYVFSSYGARDIALVKADIDTYIAQYPSVSGFFIDEMSNLPANVAYYQDLHDYIKGLNPSYSVIGNPGVNTIEAYAATADVLVTFEGSSASYANYVPNSWMAGFSASHFSHLVYGVTSNADALIAAQHALTANASNVYITEDNYIPGNPAFPNPWDTLSTYYSNKTITGTPANNALAGALGNDIIIGGAGNDTLTGGTGNDYLDGGAGIDSMIGGAGDDIYLVDTIVDIVIDNEGLNELRATISYSIASNASFDNLVLLGTGNINATGNSINNLLLGNAGNNILDGGAGNDTMEGGKGNDTYLWRDADDVFFEAANEGLDTLELASNFGFSAGQSAIAGIYDNIENLDASKVSGVAFDLVGNVLANVLTGNGADNDFDSKEGNDTLIGGAGNDGFLGGAGVDSLVGGIGNDIYAVNLKTTGLGVLAVASLEDIIVESISSTGGDDSLRLDGTANLTKASTIVLAAGLEHLYSENTLNTKLNLTGNAAANNIVGNDAANVILGLAGDDSLRGGAGDDTLDGGAGNDVYLGGAGNDTYLSELVLLGGLTHVNDTYAADESGIDTIKFSGQVVSATTLELSLVGLSGYENINISGTGSTRINLVGNVDANLLIGNVANNIIDGGVGADTMAGGAGNDTYVVDDAGDVVTELPNGGFDTVQSSINYSLLDTDGAGLNGGNVENLTLTGTDDINGAGNAIANILIGNAGYNTLTGDAGNDTLDGGIFTTFSDTLIGGTGNDTYIVDDLTDALVEIASEGNDTILSSVNLSLNFSNYNNIENLTLTGAASIALGSVGANLLTGNDGNNFLTGDEFFDNIVDVDSLKGGKGDDTYFVNLTQVGTNSATATVKLEDIVLENANEGIDEINLIGDFSALTTASTLVLGANVEKLRLDSATSNNTKLNITGNALNNTFVGNLVANKIDGGAGNDTIYGGDGIDTLIGGTGNDDLLGNAGVDNIQGGLGNDRYFVDLILNGTSDAVTLEDTITEAASAGTDEVWLYGTHSLTNATTLTIGANLENFNASNAADTKLNLTGNALNNQIIGNNVANIIDGGTGNDLVYGSEGNDSIVGGIGDDNLNGNEDNDTLQGGAGNDILDGDTGADSLIGGDGNDTYFLDDANDLVEDTIVEGSTATSGTDTVKTIFTYTLANGSNVENLTLIGNDAVDATGNALKNSITGNTNDNILDGGAGIDTLIGGLGNDTYKVDLTAAGALQDIVTEALNAGAADKIELRGASTNIAAVTLTLGANLEGLDASATGTSKLNLTGNALNNTLIGNHANNSLNGGAGNDSLNGGLGNDALDGGAGIDSLIGGIGDDTYTVDLVTTGAGALAVTGLQDFIIESVGEGTDTLTLRGSATLINASTISLIGTELENINASATGSTKLNLTGNGLDNNIIGNAANNVIGGDLGNDSLNGGTGNDTLIGGDGNDTLIGGLGVDAFNGGIGNDTYVVDSLTEANSIVDVDGNNTVNIGFSYALTSNLATAFNNITLAGITNINASGNANTNILTGNIAANVLDGKEGEDTMNGGKGADTYIVDDAGDTVTEDFTLSQGGGIDLVKSSATAFTLGLNVDNLTLTGTGNNNATGNSLNNYITGNSGYNILNGNEGNDTIIGGGVGGSGFIPGAFGDSLYGGDGNDSLVGSIYSDSLDGGSGIDTMQGGNGSDIYVVDNIKDIVIDSADEFNGGYYDEVFASVTYILPNYIEGLTLTGVTNINGTGNNLSGGLNGNSGANVLSGLGGADEINGGAGADTMIGGAGNDSFYIDNVLDVVIELNGLVGGYDRVLSSITLDNQLNLTNVEDMYLLGTDNISVTGNAFNNRLHGNTGNNLMNGGDGNDEIFGDFPTGDILDLRGDDTIYGGAGNDSIYGSGGGHNELYGGEGNDVLGGNAFDTLVGGNGNDIYRLGGNGASIFYPPYVETVVEDITGGIDTISTLGSYILGSNIENLILDIWYPNVVIGVADVDGTGNALNNVIQGNYGNNTLSGNEGADTLIGGIARDILIGGLGADTFDFNTASESTLGINCDIITDFSHMQLDKIDLSTIDADSLSTLSNQAFNFIGNDVAFNNIAGQLMFVSASNSIFGDVNGDAIADFQIQLTGITGLASSDFIL